MNLLNKLARSAMLRKTIYLSVGIIAGLCVFATPAYASSGVDPVALLKSLVDFLFSIMLYVGIIAVLFGIMTFAISFSSQDSQQRTRGIMEMIGGVLLIGAKILLNTIGVSW